MPQAIPSSTIVIAAATPKRKTGAVAILGFLAAMGKNPNTVQGSKSCRSAALQGSRTTTGVQPRLVNPPFQSGCPATKPFL